MCRGDTAGDTLNRRYIVLCAAKRSVNRFWFWLVKSSDVGNVSVRPRWGKGQKGPADLEHFDPNGGFQKMLSNHQQLEKISPSSP